MGARPLEFWFDFASTYSYIAATRIEALCARADVPLVWRPFLLGPIFKLQGLSTSPFVLDERRGKYMWRDLERLTAKFGLPWNKPTVFPRNSVLAARVAAAFADAPWISAYIHAVFLANFRDDLDLNAASVVKRVLHGLGADAQGAIDVAVNGERKEALRANTSEAIARGIFGAPNCTVGEELFWGEETLEDAVEWAR